MKQNSCLTMTYSVVLAILVICQIGAGIAGFVMKDQLFDTLETELSKTMKVVNVCFILMSSFYS